MERRVAAEVRARKVDVDAPGRGQGAGAAEVALADGEHQGRAAVAVGVVRLASIPSTASRARRPRCSAAVRGRWNEGGVAVLVGVVGVDPVRGQQGADDLGVAVVGRRR